MIRRRIAEGGLTEKLSTREAIRVLCRQRIVRLNDEWRLAEVTSKDKTLLETLGVHLLRKPIAELWINFYFIFYRYPVNTCYYVTIAVTLLYLI